MKKRTHTLPMAVAALLLAGFAILAGAFPVRADNALVMKLHYHREDGAYDGWDVWLWAEGKDGEGYPFKEENGEMVATMDVPPGTTSVGFIVRTEEWAKDIDADQFIDISEMTSGTVHIYVESGVEGYTKEYGEDAVTGTKLKTAVYDGKDSIILTMTGELESAAPGQFKISGKSGEVALNEITGGSNFVYTAVLSEPLDAAKSYTITFDGTDYSIRMPIIYSTKEFEDAYTYDGEDLGAVWTKEKTTFRVWAPTAESVSVNLYETGTPNTSNLIESLPMKAAEKGNWVLEKDGDLNGTYYTYSVGIDGTETEACDPYARTTGVNGGRAMVIDLDSTDPDGWDSDKNPHAGESINDAVIYELHIRDLSADKSSGITHTGKYLGLTETGTTTGSGIPTGLDHIKELGITHLHILPFYDYGSINEYKENGGGFNWGYDPVNYNVPEGSYSTDATKGEVRVAEVKQMVQSLHENGISVVMDVVYNHVYNAEQFCINRIVPGYFSRINEDGTYSNGSYCGNDTASERSMVKKYIVDSVCYWVDEYHIDGFRFDLVGLLDTETVNEIVAKVHETHPDVIFYGEGWKQNTTLTKDGYTLATQTNSGQTPDFAYFNDTIRDMLKGNVFEDEGKGFVSGAQEQESILQSCFMGAPFWCHSPSQTVNYVSCHDNMTLRDRLASARPDADDAALIRMNNLAAAVYMTAEGIPFMQAGEEMLRTKIKSDGTYDTNSYASSDQVNSLKWNTLEEEAYQKVYEYYKGLIAFRKAHGVLRLSNAEDVENHVTAVEGLDANVVAFDIQGGINEEPAEELFVIFNANESESTVTLPEGTWEIYINDEKAGTEALGAIQDEKAVVAPISAMVLIKAGGAAAGNGTPSGASSGSGAAVGIAIAVITFLVLCAVIALSKKRKEK